jgi:hypothetical protein
VSLNFNGRQVVILGAIAMLSVMSSAIAQPPILQPQMSADEHHEHGLTSYAHQDWEGASDAFTQAIQINPGDRDGYYCRGFAQYRPHLVCPDGKAVALAES